MPQPRWIAFVNLCITAALLSACGSAAPPATAAPTSTELATEAAVTLTASAPTPTPAAADDLYPELGDVLVPLPLSPEQIARLEQSGVVASPRDYEEFYELYSATQRANLPLFVTSDSLLHAYHLVFDKSLRTLEEKVFLPKLQAFDQTLLAQAEAQLAALQGTDWAEPARHVVAYVAVAGRLADPAFVIPASVSDLAEAELLSIEAAQTAPSAIFPLLKYGEDYSQYTPRGHYNRNEALQSYFRSMMWYGRMTFRLNDPENAEIGPSETRMALLLVLAIRDAGLVPAWDELYDPTAFLVGRSDDLTIHDYLPLVETVYGAGAPLSLVADDEHLADFIAAASELPAPRILGLISDDYKPIGATQGLRLMGQRFLPDNYVFQELIHPKVPARYLPTGLDVMRVLGSERARVWLAEDATAQAPEYASQSEMLIDWVNGLSASDWTDTSVNGWLYTLRPLLAAPAGDSSTAAQGTPPFMQTAAWQDKQLNTALGSWAELKHDTLLYAKQVYGGKGAGGPDVAPPDPVDAANYVEPVPEVFARLAGLVERTVAGLRAQGMFTDVQAEQLELRFQQLLEHSQAFQQMAESELQGQALSEDEQSRIRTYGSYLEDVVQWSSDYSDADPAALIADVATDPNSGQVLEVGVGAIHELYVVAPVLLADGTLQLSIARGGIFSYYEFPSAERLTDETWRARVGAGDVPAQPNFAANFSVPQAASTDMQRAVYDFQLGWRDLVFYCGDPDWNFAWDAQNFATGIRPQVQAVVQTLLAAHQYEGRQWISSDYLSVERPGETQAIVTVRETWSDYLAQYEGDLPFAWYYAGLPEPIVGRRGPYTVDVRYTLTGSDQDGWSVVAFEELAPRPEWGAP